jgi:hypothetical protein
MEIISTDPGDRQPGILRSPAVVLLGHLLPPHLPLNLQDTGLQDRLLEYSVFHRIGRSCHLLLTLHNRRKLRFGHQPTTRLCLGTRRCLPRTLLHRVKSVGIEERGARAHLQRQDYGPLFENAVRGHQKSLPSTNTHPLPQQKLQKKQLLLPQQSTQPEN